MTGSGVTVRDVTALPKAHLHLHFTGSMRHPTLVELAAEHGIRLPEQLREHWPPVLSARDERGWFRFQRLYDIARSVLRTPAEVTRLVREAAEDEAADGSRWLEIQVDPSGYASRFHNITTFTEIVLSAAVAATEATGVEVRIVIAANRIRHPLDARTLARLAARYATGNASTPEAGSGRLIVGFGLSNDERRGDTRAFAPAFRIARDAGLRLVPHGGELCGPEMVEICVDVLGAQRLGHGVRAAEDPALVERLVTAGIGFELCPASNVALGVYADPADVPLRQLFDAGAQIALGADDPVLFGSRVAAQYASARDVHGFDDTELAELARRSILASCAPDDTRAELLAGVDDWLAPVRASSSPAPAR